MPDTEQPTHPGRAPAHTRAIGLPLKALLSFHPSRIPVFSRRNYAMELRAAFALPFLLVVVDSGVIGVLVKNAYEGVVSDRVLNMAVAILAASTAAANIASFIWVRISNGADKVRFINGVQIAMVLIVAAIALAPRTPSGLLLLTIAVIAGRLCWAGFITIRSTIWGANYAPRVRARVTGKLATVQVTMLSLLGLGLGKAMNIFPEADRLFFLVGAVISLYGVYAWSQIRVRGHRSLRNAELAFSGREAPTFSPMSVVNVLRADRRYASFMTWMFLLGLGNLMLVPILTIAARDRFNLEYLGGIAIVASIPLAMMPFMIPIWARLLDRVHVIRFRAIHSWAFVAAHACCALAVAMGSLPLLVLASIFKGVGYAGGVLAWNLGHLDFAPRGMESQYMGVHGTLNGVRGIIAPFLAVGIYELAIAIDPRLAVVAFLATVVLTLAGAIGFTVMSRKMGDQATRGRRPAEVPPPSRVG